MLRCLAIAALAISSASCGDGGATATVEVRTDYVPGIEFSAVLVDFERVAEPVERAAFRGDDFIAGVEVAEFSDVAPGMYELHVRLLDAARAVVAERTTRVAISGNVTVAVLFTRDAEVECTSDDGCSSSVECAVGRCVDGLCLGVADDEACGAGEYCNPAMGCISELMDAGRMDAAPRDAGPVDAAADASPDASSMDAASDTAADVAVDTSVTYPPDLVGYWPCDEAGPSAIVDVTGNGHDAFCSGDQCPSIVPGIVGSACGFDSSLRQRGRMFDDPALRPANFTITLFFRASALTTMFARPLGASNNESYALKISTYMGPLQVRFSIGRSLVGTSATFTTSFAPGTWHHIAATYDGTNARIFMDGLPIRQTSADIVYDDNDVFIGSDFNSGGEANYYNGTLDEIRFYDRVLSEAEIATLAAM